jgi:phosphohistidine phosphatase
MKTLLLMRHAKSSWKESKLADHERPLNKRGRHDAPMMGELLIERELVPQKILCSSALRARQTAELLAENAGYSEEITYSDRLYLAEADEYFSALRELPDDIDRVMLIGHNPGLETLLQLLSGQIQSLPTAVIAHLSLPVDSWADISSETAAELVEIWRPKEIKQFVGEEEKEEASKGKDKRKSKEKTKEEKPKNEEKGKKKGK